MDDFPLHAYKQFIKTIVNDMPDNELETFIAYHKVKHFKKNDFIYKPNSVQLEFGFIVNGLVRSFYENEKGKEITVRFHFENAFVTHYTAFITQTKSNFNYKCLEPTTIVALSYVDLQLAYKNLPSIQVYGRLMAEEILKMHQSRIDSFLFQTPEERYINFIEKHPHVIQRISLSHLCSYLGIERQTLTRIRQKMANTKTNKF